MSVREIEIGRDYTILPGGRYKKYGPFSGEDFRDSILAPALRENSKVIVYLDGVKTYMSSFLEEAFGGLIRERKFRYDDLKAQLIVKAREPKYAIYVKIAEQDMRAAANEANGGKPVRVA